MSASPTPLVRLSLLRLFQGRRNPIKVLDYLAAQPGHLARVQVGPQSIVLLKHPDLIQQLLVGEAKNVEKGRTFERALFFTFLGEGLLNSRGEAHRRQRRIVLPGFHRERIKGYGDAMVGASVAAMASWRDRDVRDMNAEMMALTLRIVGQTLFSASVGDAAEQISGAFARLTANVNRMSLPGARWLLKTPLPFARRVRAAEAALNTAVYEIIRSRRALGRDTGDLLSMLLLAEDAENPGKRLSDTEIRDQAMTLFFAGHETTANVLSWAWWLLAQNPAAEAALHAELDQVLAGRTPDFADVPQLPFTEQIVSEVLRLYPPIWAMGRRALREITFEHDTVAADTLLVASQWVSHRDARYFPDPHAFRPERWTAAFRQTLPRFAYFPFGGGPRSCMGENFAWTELVLVLATLAQRWRFTLTPEARAVVPQARITLHPDRPVRLQLQRRA